MKPALVGLASWRLTRRNLPASEPLNMVRALLCRSRYIVRAKIFFVSTTLRASSLRASATERDGPSPTVQAPTESSRQSSNSPDVPGHVHQVSASMEWMEPLKANVLDCISAIHCLSEQQAGTSGHFESDDLTTKTTLIRLTLALRHPTSTTRKSRCGSFPRRYHGGSFETLVPSRGLKAGVQLANLNPKA
jgi:hypothetical protein